MTADEPSSTATTPIPYFMFLLHWLPGQSSPGVVHQFGTKPVEGDPATFQNYLLFANYNTYALVHAASTQHAKDIAERMGRQAATGDLNQGGW